MSKTLLLISDEGMLRHDATQALGYPHPEQPARLQAVTDRLRSEPRLDARWVSPRHAPFAALAAVHAPAYVEQIERLSGRVARLDVDTAVGPGSVEAALQAAGGALRAVDELMTAGTSRAFALVRPPGHHAERDRAMGFCLFNNVACGAQHAVERHGCARVLIVDWDVHHGNGTQHLFEARRDVLVFNTHQFPLYPGTGRAEETGRGEGAGFTINVPLPAGSGDADYLAVYEELLIPIAEQFCPELILVSAGFDGHRDDPLAGMSLTEKGFAAMCEVVSELADRLCGGRLGLVLEGGYDLESLAHSVMAVATVLSGADAPKIVADAGPAAREAIARTAMIQGRFWRLS